MNVKKIVLNDKHVALGAKMVDFAGYLMPVQYSGILEEHLNVRNNVGVFDVSHMGEFMVKGRNALSFLQKVTSNDVSKLTIGQVQYSCMPNKTGGIVDDLLVYRLSEENLQEGETSFMLVVNASNIDKDWNWLMDQIEEGVEMENLSEEISLLAVQGPKAVNVLQPLTQMNLKDMPYYHFDKGILGGLEDVLISSTGYTGAGGFEIYVKNNQVEQLWDLIFEEGKKLGIQPAGLGSRDTLRLEKGFCLYGNDIDDTTSPLEAGLGWITKLGKGEFNSSHIFRKQKEQGLVRKLCAFVMEERRVPRNGYNVVDASGDLSIGKVTSGGMSPCLEKNIGLAYLPVEHSKEGTTIGIEFGKKILQAKVVKLPFL
jgi:aminomethyltransferase